MKKIVAALGLLLALSACNGEEAVKALTEGSDADFAQKTFEELHARKYEAIEAKADKALANGNLRPALVQMGTLMPDTPPKALTVAGINISVFPDRNLRRVNVTLEAEFAGSWLLANLQWRSDGAGGQTVLEGMNLQPLPASLRTINAFTIQDKGIGHYLMLAAAVVMPLFSLAVLIICLRTPLPRRSKVLWALGIILGVGKLTLDWTTGAVALNPLSIQFFSAAFFRPGPLAPYLLSISIPVFAVWFLIRRGKIAVQQN